MSVVPRRRAGLRTVGVLLALWLPVLAGLPAQAQTADQTNTNATIQAPTSSIFPAQSTTSRTCNFGCTSQVQACQNTCITTSTGTTVIPSVTTVGSTTNPQTCQTNCTTQLTTCQRNCNLGP
ncbi:MAG TPA: hypothetical protein VGG01_23970 [Xanthobacteraceae bacterium]